MGAAAVAAAFVLTEGGLYIRASWNLQAAASGDFELGMDDLQKLMSIMEQHIMNLKSVLPLLHNTVVSTYR